MILKRTPHSRLQTDRECRLFMLLAPSSPTSLSKRPRVDEYTPDKNGNFLPPSIVEEWGACFKCHKPGHFARDCTFRSRVFVGKYATTCPLCGDNMLGKELVYEDAGVMCARCRVGESIVHHDKVRKTLAFNDAEVPGPPAAEKTDQEKVRECVESSDEHIGVEARAGSGKTHLICCEAKRANGRGERILALTLNRDAAIELRSRGLKEARTFHSLGFAAWKRAQQQRMSVVEADEDEAATAKNDGEALDAGTAYMKSKLLLRHLYPRPSDAPKRQRLSLEVVLFESFVVELVALAKAAAVGICDPDGSEPYPDKWSTWKRLERKFGSGKRIEGTLKKKLAAARRAEATRRWPTAVARLQAGIGLAREVFAASITSATASDLDGVAKLYMSDRKGYTLPLLDYGDMIYMPLYEALSFDPVEEDEPPLAWLYVDEAQDTSRARRLMCSALINENDGARLFAVGDSMQALYGFSGADTDALAQMFEAFSCQPFTLPVCRRCPATHVALANGVIEKVGGGVPMQPLAGAPPGHIHRGGDFMQFPLESSALVTSARPRCGAQPPQDNSRAILARRNAPLLAMLYCLAARGIACAMAGRDQLAARLKKATDELRRQVGATASLISLVQELPSYVQRQREARADSADDADEYPIQDVADCIETVVQQLHERRASPPPTVDDLLEELGARFSSASRPMPPDAARQAVTLTTVHKAKGREWQWVYVLQPEELPLPFVVSAGGTWQARQEYNVEYVALTRSKLHLVFLRNLELDGSGTSTRRALDALFAPGANAPRRPAAAEHGHWNDAYRQYWRERRQEERAATDAEWEGEGGEEASMSVAAARQQLRLPELPAAITLASVRKAYLDEAKRAHPDKVSRGLTAPHYEAAIVAAEKEMKLLNLAREVLSRESARE